MTGAVLAALFALLTQALLPAAALASESLGGQIVEICSDQGAQTIFVGKDGQAQKKGFAGLPCQDCLGATLATMVTPELAVVSVAYVVAHTPYEVGAGAVAPRARAPPRPFGQGPPSENA